MPRRLGKPAIKRLVSTWAARLNLRDWDIELEIVKSLDDGKYCGMITWECDRRTAYMSLEHCPQSKELEKTIIHELLHVVWTGHSKRVGGYNVHEERSIEAITAALYDGYHRVPKLRKVNK